LAVGTETIELDALDVVTIDDNSRKLITARLAPFFRPLFLWAGDGYDNVGDYTQAKVESKIFELLGDNAHEKMQSLIKAR
jgi:hypothetical protein